jgi:class 3 adenylate cyclase
MVLKEHLRHRTTREQMLVARLEASSPGIHREPDRLDFTVIGLTANEVRRIASMWRSFDRNISMSSSFVEATKHEKHEDIRSVAMPVEASIVLWLRSFHRYE